MADDAYIRLFTLIGAVSAEIYVIKQNTSSLVRVILKIRLTANHYFLLAHVFDLSDALTKTNQLNRASS